MKKKLLFIPLLMGLSLSGCIKYNGLPPEEAAHEHTYSEEYSYNETEHWFAATCDHTELRKDVAEHTFGDFVTTQEPTILKEGEKVRTCSVCNYKDVQKIDKLPGNNEGGDNPGGSGDDNPGGGEQPGGDTPSTWSITGLSLDRESIELTIGDNPVSVTATLTGTGDFPTTLAVSASDMISKKIVDGEEVDEAIKIVNLSANVVESGHAFTVTPVAAGTTTITVKTTYTDPEIVKTINVTVNPKVEHHELSLLDSDIEVNKGSVYVLNCTSTDDVTWSSSDDTIVALENKTNTGVWLKGLKSSGSDKVTITATICGGTEYEVVKTCLVKVVNTEQTVFSYYYINNQKLADLHVYLWGEGIDANEAWPGASLSYKNYVNKEYFDVYTITIDKEVAAYEKMIVSGKDANGEFVQTDDILLTSFVTQNAFSIPSLPTDVVEGTRKASVIYTSADEVDIDVTNGDESVQLVDPKYSGFTVRALKEGEATVEVSVLTNSGKLTKTLTINVIKDTKYTYYFTNNYAWTDLKIYFFNATSGRSNASFPGVSLRDVAYVDENRNDVYEISYLKIADNWEGFIISGTDTGKGATCKTEDILFANFGENNGVKLNDWKGTEGDDAFVAKVEYGKFSNTLYVKVSTESIELQVGKSAHLEVFTNATNVEYEIHSGGTKIELSNETKQGVDIKGIQRGEAFIKVKADDADPVMIAIRVVEDELLSIYFVNEFEWTDVKAHLYIDENNNNGWPGDTMELLGYNKDGKEVYRTTFWKLENAWTGVVFSGYDVLNGGRAQTGDVKTADLIGNDNCVIVTGWEEQVNLKASTDIIPCPDYLMISKDSLNLFPNKSERIDYSASKAISFEISDSSVISVTKNDGYFDVQALKEGLATIAFSINAGDEKIEKTCSISVGTNEVITYYFSNNYNWTFLSAHLWGPKGEDDIDLTYSGLKNKEGQDVYQIDFYKLSDAFTGMVLFGTDETYGPKQTIDIIFANLEEGQNNFYLTGWDGEGKATIGTATYDINFLELDDKSPRTVYVGESIDLQFNSYFPVSYDTDYTNVTVSEDLFTHVVTITGQSVGQTELTFYIGTDTDRFNEMRIVINVEEMPSEFTYTITNVNSYYPEANAQIYAWVWGGNSAQNSGTWIECTYENGCLTFKSDIGEFTNVSIVRNDPANPSGNPSWDDAYIWNKSQELSFSNRTAEYSRAK